MKTTATLQYLVDSVFYKQAATDDFWTLMRGALADDYTRNYPRLTDAADTPSVLASNGVLAAAAATAAFSGRSEGQGGWGLVQVDTAALTLGHRLRAAIKTGTVYM